MSRKLALVAAFVCLLALVAKPVWDGREQWHFGQSYDDGVYWVAAKSLASGEGYRISNLPGKPFAMRYPPLYPLYLSIAWRLQPAFPDNLRIAAALQAMLLPVYLALLLLALRQFGFSWRRTLLTAGIVIVTFPVILLTVTLFAELLFGCFLMAAIIAVERSAGERRPACRFWALAGGALAGLAYLTRSAGLPLFLAVPVFFFLRKRLSLLPYFFAAALPLAAGWHIWTTLHTGGNPDTSNINYWDSYLRAVRATGFWAGIVRQLDVLSASIAENFFPGIMRILGGLPLYHIVFAAGIAGGVRLGRRRHWPLFLIFSAFYLAMIVCWWFDGLTRLVLPVWPALLAGIAEEASHVASLCQKSMARSPFWSRPIWSRNHLSAKQAPAWLFILAGVCIVIRNDRSTWDRISSTMAREHKLRLGDFEAFSWVKTHASQDTVALAWKDSASFLYTGVPASRGLFLAVTPQTADEKALAASFSALPARYQRGLLLLLVSDLGDGFKDRRLDPFAKEVAALPGSRLEYSSPASLIYSFPIQR